MEMCGKKLDTRWGFEPSTFQPMLSGFSEFPLSVSNESKLFHAIVQLKLEKPSFGRWGKTQTKLETGSRMFRCSQRKQLLGSQNYQTH